MNTINLFLGLSLASVCLAPGGPAAPKIDHNCTDLSGIPPAWITQAKTDLHIAYQHTSHGSQLISGMDALAGYVPFGNTYEWSDNGSSGLDLDDYGIPGTVNDLSYGDYLDEHGVAPWVTATRTLLDNTANYHLNVIIWSWCSINGHNAQLYVDSMEILISEYGPGGSKARAAEHPVLFVFMTGHAEGQGEYEEYNSGDGSGNVHYNNQLIRQHCAIHNRTLFDFADIEAYNPDGAYFWDLDMYDNLDYTDPGNGERNWAEDWVGANSGSELALLTAQCPSCAHSDSPAQATLNCVLKGRAAWWLFARLAGWSGAGSTPTPPGPTPVPTPSPCTVTLSGYATAATTAAALPGAQVAIFSFSGGWVSCTAAADGAYTLTVPADDCAQAVYEAAVFAPGYHGVRRQLSLTAGVEGTADFALLPDPPCGSTDFDGDGTSDPAYLRPAQGFWAARGLTRFYFGQSGDVPVPADFDGDGTADWAYFRPSQGLWAVRGITRAYFGGAGDLPVPADFDGDGCADLAFFRPGQGLWKVMGTTRIYTAPNGSVPVPADYDGDGTVDCAGFLDGLWNIRSQTRLWLGRPGDIPIPRDYAGDGQTACAVYRPSERLWIGIAGSSRIYFGQPWDDPVPADFTGDGSGDPGCFRSGLWNIRFLTRTYLGRSGDIPLAR